MLTIPTALRGWLSSAGGSVLLFAVLFSTSAQAALPDFQPSGDALYDRYAQFVLSELERNHWHINPGSFYEDGGMGAQKPSWMRQSSKLCERLSPYLEAFGGEQLGLDYGVIRDWEAEFASDPRYWEMRLVCRIDELPYPGNTAPASPSPLITLCGSGQADEGAFATVNFLELWSCNEDAGKRLIEQAIGQFPDNSYWYYQKALMLLNAGEAAAALDTLRRGNAAPRNEWPQPWPLVTLLDSRYSAGQADGNRILQGFLSAQSGGYYEPGASHWPVQLSEANKSVCTMLALGSEAALADEVIRMDGRLGRMSGAVAWLPGAASFWAAIVPRYSRDEILPEPWCNDLQLTIICSLPGMLVEDAAALWGANNWSDSAHGGYETAFAGYLRKYDGEDVPGLRNFNIYASRAPALVLEDWLNLEMSYRHNQLVLAARQEMLKPTADPPLARLYKAALQAETEAH